VHRPSAMRTRLPAIRMPKPSLEPSALVSLRFLDANPHPRLSVARPLAGRVNYLLGNDPQRWIRGLRTYGEVRYQGLYPGVDARFYGRQGRLEYDLLLAPGADPARIGFTLAGARGLRLDGKGDLLVAAAG